MNNSEGRLERSQYIMPESVEPNLEARALPHSKQQSNIYACTAHKDQPTGQRGCLDCAQVNNVRLYGDSQSPEYLTWDLDRLQKEYRALMSMYAALKLREIQGTAAKEEAEKLARLLNSFLDRVRNHE